MSKVAKLLTSEAVLSQADIIGFHSCNGSQHWVGAAFEFDETTEKEPYRKGVVIVVPCDPLFFRTEYLNGKVQVAPLPDIEEKKTWLQDKLDSLKRAYIKP